MKAAVTRAVISLLLLLTSSATTAAASPATTTLQLRTPDGQGWASARRLLLLRQPATAASNTFDVKGAAHHQPAGAATAPKPKNVEFDASTRSAPGSRFNPRHN